MGEQMSEVVKKCREILAFASAACRAEGYLAMVKFFAFVSYIQAFRQRVSLQHLNICC